MGVRATETIDHYRHFFQMASTSTTHPRGSRSNAAHRADNYLMNGVHWLLERLSSRFLVHPCSRDVYHRPEHVVFALTSYSYDSQSPLAALVCLMLNKAAYSHFHQPCETFSPAHQRLAAGVPRDSNAHAYFAPHAPSYRGVHLQLHQQGSDHLPSSYQSALVIGQITTHNLHYAVVHCCQV